MKMLLLMAKNALRNRRRTVLTILSIAISIFLVSTLDAVLASMYRSEHSNGQSEDLRVIVHRATSITQPMPQAYREQIAGVRGVRAVVGQQWFGGQYKSASNFFANYAVNSDQFQKVYPDLVIPAVQLAAWKNEQTAALVGSHLMKQYDWHVGQRITLKGEIFPVNPELTIRAVYHDPSDRTNEASLYFHYKYLDEMMGEPGQVGMFVVRVDSAGDVPKVAKAIDAMYHNTSYETKTETEQAFQLSFVSMLGNVKLLLTAISVVVVFTILLVAGNTMAMAIRERTNEVAVLKTLGFRRRMILILLVGESLVIALLGGLAGAFGAKGAYAFVRLTYLDHKALGMVFALGVGAALAYGTWTLFQGVAGRRWVKGFRWASTGFGAFAGLVAGLTFFMGVGMVMNAGFFLADFGVPLGTVAICLGIAAAVGLISALFPALRASRISIAEALRYVG